LGNIVDFGDFNGGMLGRIVLTSLFFRAVNAIVCGKNSEVVLIVVVSLIEVTSLTSKVLV
jgi:hypothetical protein